MFPETFVVLACFPNVSQFCHTRNIVSSYNVCFREAKYVSATRQKHSVFPWCMENMFPDVSQFCHERQHYVRQITERRDIHPHKALVWGRVLCRQIPHNGFKGSPLASSFQPQSIRTFLSLSCSSPSQMATTTASTTLMSPSAILGSSNCNKMLLNPVPKVKANI